MNQRWTLHVENFARIESADIEIAPLMCFIGDNNSGKSYIMALLWGIIANGHMFYYDRNQSCVDSPEYIKCQEWLLSNIGKRVEITVDIAQGSWSGSDSTYRYDGFTVKVMDSRWP